jgi:hypothetical protein
LSISSLKQHHIEIEKAHHFDRHFIFDVYKLI